VKRASNRLPFGGILQQGNNRGRRYTPHNRVHRRVTRHVAGINNEDGWLGDAALLSRIVDTLVPNNATFHIAQNRKRQSEVNPQCLRLVGGTSVAEFERELIRERTLAGVRQAQPLQCKVECCSRAVGP